MMNSINRTTHVFSSSGTYGNISTGYRAPMNTGPTVPLHQNYGTNYGNVNNPAIHTQPLPGPQPFYGQPPPPQMFHQPMPNTYPQMGHIPRPMNPPQTLDNRGYGQTVPHQMQNRSFVHLFLIQNQNFIDHFC